MLSAVMRTIIMDTECRRGNEMWTFGMLIEAQKTKHEILSLLCRASNSSARVRHYADKKLMSWIKLEGMIDLLF